MLQGVWEWGVTIFWFIPGVVMLALSLLILIPLLIVLVEDTKNWVWSKITDRARKEFYIASS